MKLTALSVMAFAASGLAQSTKNHCNTSGASPMLHHVQAVIDNTGNAGFGEQVCLQYALGSDDCTGTIKDYSGKGGGAALMMCKGPGKEQTYRCQNTVPGSPASPGSGSGLPYRAMPGYLESLRDECVATIDGVERVGGWVDFDDGGAELRLIRMPG